MRFLILVKGLPVPSAIDFAFYPGLVGRADLAGAGLGLATSMAGAWVSLASGVLHMEAGSGLSLADRRGTQLCCYFGSLMMPGKTSDLGVGTGFNRN